MSKTFTVHHETSRAASRKLSVWFWSGVALSFVSYSLVAWGFLALIFYLFAVVPSGLPTFAVLVGLATSLGVLFGYYLARAEAHSTPAWQRAQALGAEPLDTPAYPAERQYRNIVLEMAVAAGIRPPDILLLRHDNSINAFVIGGARGSTALAVSAGALRYLSRDELQALIAHEFGHLVNDDLSLYGRLSAMIHGYRFLAEAGGKLFGAEQPVLNIREQQLIANADVQNEDEALAVRQLAYAAASRRMADAQERDEVHGRLYASGVGFLLSALILLLSAYNLLLTAYARLMQAAIAREREWMADAKAVQFTRNAPALAGVFAKVLAWQRAFAQPPAVLMENRHLLLINYLQTPESKRLHTHPDTLARLKRYGDYSYDAIAKLAWQLSDIPPYEQANAAPERSQTYFADVLFPFMLLRHHASLQLPEYPPQAVVLVSLMRLANATPKGLLQHGKLDAATLQPLLPVWQKLLPAHQASFLPLLLRKLRQLDNLSALNAPLHAIVAADGLTSLGEWCAITAIDALQIPFSDNLDYHHPDIAAALPVILRLTAHLAANNEAARAALYHELARQTLPIALPPWQSVTTHKQVPVPCKGADEPGWPIEPLILPSETELTRARAALFTLRQLRGLYRHTLRQGLARTLENETLSIDAYGYLQLLKTLLTTETQDTP